MESLSLASIGLMLQPDSNHRDWNPTQRYKDSKAFRTCRLFKKNQGKTIPKEHTWHSGQR